MPPAPEGPRQSGRTFGEAGDEAASTVPSPPPRPSASEPSRPALAGADVQAVTPRGRPIDARYEVHEARDLVTSDHPAFDPRFQPRDRGSRAASDAQIADIASRLDAEQLNGSRLAAQGSPIIGPDRMVESGNGRVAAIRRAYEMHPERAAEYRAMVERQGFDTAGFEHPVLVRRRTTEMGDGDRAAFVREANERDTMGMSSTEQAGVDAGAMTSDVLGTYRGGSVTDAGNRDFVRAWIDKVATPAERNQLMQPDGTLSADGVRRLRSSLLAKAFDDADLVAKVVEDPDTEIRAIGATLTDAAPGFAKLRERVAAGELPRDYDITHQVAEAANMIATARQQGKKIGDAFKQDDMFGGRTDPVTEAVARLMFKDEAMTKPRSAADMADGLRFYLDEAAKHSETDMFGGGASRDRAVDVIEAARERIDKRGEKGATMFSRARSEGLGRDRGSVSLASELDGLLDHANSAVRGLASRLRDLVGDAEARFDDDMGPDVRGAATLHDDGRVSASIARRGDAETTLHEAVHVATLSRYGQLVDGATEGHAVDPHVQAIENLRARAAKAFVRRGDDPSGQIAHALSSTDEFLAGALTSPRVQAFLKRQNTAGLWGRFVDGVRGVLGLLPRYGSLLDRVLEHGARLIDAMATDTPRTGGAVTLQSRAKGWRGVGDLVFEKDLLDEDGPAMSAAVRSTFGDPKRAAASAWDRMKAFGETVAYSADSAARSIAGRFNAPTVAKFADLFHAEAGKTDRAVGGTYSEAVTRMGNRYLNDLHAALKPHLDNAPSMERIRDLLANPTGTVRATAEERAAAGTVRDLLKEVLDYRRDAGEEIGEVRDGYFPRTTRFDKVAADPGKFQRAAAATYRDAGLGVKEANEAADALLVRAINGSMNISDAATFGGGGKPSSAKAREFGKYADVRLRDFYETNPMRALSGYMEGAVRRAEESRRFGKVGRDGSAERAAWERQHGDKSRWDVMKAQMQTELRENGADARGIMERIEAIRATNLGHQSPGAVKAGATISVIHAWNQLGTLAQSWFASMPELAMGFVRGGPRYGFHHLSTTFGEFARNVRKAPQSDARRWAEAAGAVGADTATDLMRARADDPTQNVGVQRLLNSFYRKNGLEHWTSAGRTAAVSTARRFVDVLSHDMESTSARTRVRAAGYLRELGVSEPEGFAGQVRAGGPKLEDLRGDDRHAADYATALLRFANQSVLLPTRAVKPTWASHPLGSLLFALQSYNYAFKKNVLDRVGRETLAGIKDRDPAKLAAASGLVVLTGTTALIQGLRHTIYGTPASDQEQTAAHYALETLDRTGIFGAASPLLNAFQGLRYQRSVGNVLQGAVIGRAAQALDAVGGLATARNSDNTNTAERKAAGAVYDMVVRPAVNAIGAGVLRGAVGSAVILGTGAKPNGLVVNDKGAAVDAIAGPDETDDDGQ